jgi:UDP-N-acetylglucosamine transferase subunit ALG13
MTSQAGSPLVLVVAGTDHHPFDRVVGWADTWAAAHPDVRVVVQYGTSRPPSVAEGFDLLPIDRLNDLLRAATVVVCHGGPGTIMGAREAGLMPLVVARQHDLGEHVDDHQVRFSSRMGTAGQVRLVKDQGTFDELLVQATEGGSGFRFDLVDEDPAAQSVARFASLVEELMARRPRTP